MGRRHGLELVNIFDRDARLNDNAPEAYRGLDRFVARQRVVAEMASLGYLEKTEENLMTVPYGDRSGVVIEPWLTDQWFADAATLAKPAIEAVETGRTRFVPGNWEKTYFEWMRNIQPWCISRQLWWGHQIPAWYGPDGAIFVEMGEDAAQAAADKHYGETVTLKRDEDVLDTWFSSALWPFSTLGWPQATPEVERYYPTDVLVTSFDIIFFWVARMMMMGLHFMDEVPFHTVYIHALVRDERGQKMSKSKGNVMNPLDLFEKYGTDAVRFTLAVLAAQGTRRAACRKPYRGLPQLRHQAVERRPLLPDERMHARRRVRPGGLHANGQPLDRRQGGGDHGGGRKRRWRPTVSTMPPGRSTALSGAPSAIGTWNSPNRS